MDVKVAHFFTKKRILLLGVALLLFPALLTHLGLVALYDDEGIRTLVALEMQASGNLITPTMFGEFYYNKPPLYNWVLLAVFEMTGRNDEFVARLPTVFFLLLFCFSVWKMSSAVRKFGSSAAGNTAELLPALALLTCGRILFWDSMLALIDICFSWVMYGLFMVIFFQGEKGRYGRLFAYAYGLAAIGFMLKGLPAIVFLGFALPTYFIWKKQWRLLFSWQHVVGALAFILPVGAYYFAYAKYNGLGVVFATLFNESAKRTAVQYGLGETVAHLFTFPFEMWYHFLPWTLLAVYFFRKNAWRLIRENRFVTWNLLVLATTILPYWASVQVYPRYLFMHVPLAFTAFFYLHSQNKKAGAKMTQVLENVFFALCLVATAASVFPLFWEAVAKVPGRIWKTAFLTLSLAVLSFLFWKWRQHRMLVFVLVMLVARMGLNWFVLPTRPAVECSTKVRETTLEAVKKLGGAPLKIYKNSLGEEPATGYYYTRETGQVLRREHGGTHSGEHLLIDLTAYKYPKDSFTWLMPVRVRWNCGQLSLVKKK